MIKVTLSTGHEVIIDEDYIRKNLEDELVERFISENDECSCTFSESQNHCDCGGVFEDADISISKVESFIEMSPIVLDYNIEEIKAKFLNGEQIAFGTDDQGICSMAKLCDTKEEFYAAYCEKVEDSIDIEDFIPMYVYYSHKIAKLGCDGIASLPKKVEEFNDTSVKDYVFIALIWGTEY